MCKNLIKSWTAMPTQQETIRIPPSQGAAAELKLLAFFDILWIHIQPTRCLVFYNYPCSTVNFLDRRSETQGITLSHSQALPSRRRQFAHPFWSRSVARVPLHRRWHGPAHDHLIQPRFSQSSGDHPQDADQFYDFMPPLWPATEELGFKIIPLLTSPVMHNDMNIREDCKYHWFFKNKNTETCKRE